MVGARRGAAPGAAARRAHGRAADAAAVGRRAGPPARTARPRRTSRRSRRSAHASSRPRSPSRPTTRGRSSSTRRRPRTGRRSRRAGRRVRRQRARRSSSSRRRSTPDGGRRAHAPPSQRWRDVPARRRPLRRAGARGRDAAGRLRRARRAHSRLTAFLRPFNVLGWAAIAIGDLQLIAPRDEVVLAAGARVGASRYGVMSVMSPAAGSVHVDLARRSAEYDVSTMTGVPCGVL